MTPFYFVVATLPMALYILALAWLHWRPTPFAVDGRRDFIALSFALSGVFFIGPGQLLAPFGAMLVWGANVWILCGLLFVCVVFLISATLRPRVVVYNASRDQLRKALTSLAITLDDEARWAGASLNLPGLGVQFYIEDGGIGRVASLVGFGAERSTQGWRRLETELSEQLQKLEPSRRPGRWLFAAVGWAVLIADAFCVSAFYTEIGDAFRFFLSV